MIARRTCSWYRRPCHKWSATIDEFDSRGLDWLRLNSRASEHHTYSESSIIAKNPTVTFSCAGGHGAPPLRGGFVSRSGITTAEPTTRPWFRNIRRPRHACDVSTARPGPTFTASQALRLKIQLSRFPVRADTAVRPYAEDLFQEKASPQPKRPQDRGFVTSGDLGTHAMYLLRKQEPHLQRVRHFR